MIFLCIYFYKKSGRGQGIRTLGGFHLAGFQNRYNRPTLSILYNLMVRMVRIELTLRNRNGILSPARLPIPPHSHMCILKVFQKKWWLETESNCRHKDFQSFALPTELSNQYKLEWDYTR